MIIVMITIAIIIIGVIMEHAFDRFGSAFYNFTMSCIGGCVAILAGVALFIEGMLIGFSQLRPKPYESMHAKYTVLTRVIDETIDTGTVVEKKELYLDIEEYNVDVRRTKRFAASYWTNWFYGPGWEELKEIEY